jgi:AcrR family transcriptional regulator
MTAQERREAALRAAVGEFGRRGYEATSTHTIAQAIGVSQPYLFRLFVSKKRLFAATAEWAFAQLALLLRQAALRAAPGLELESCTLVFTRPSPAGRELLRFELALCGSAADPELARAARRHFAALRAEVAEVTRAPEEDVQAFLATLSWLIVSSLMDDPHPIPTPTPASAAEVP